MNNSPTVISVTMTVKKAEMANERVSQKEREREKLCTSCACSQEGGGTASARSVCASVRGQLKFIMPGNRSGACTHLGTRVPARYYD